MSTRPEMPKAYEPAQVEDALYQQWESAGVFKAHPDAPGEPYAILMPPPNRTGTLHMGHASMLAIQDVLIRFHRLRGDDAVWIPGTDHAAIATQVKVEQLLIKKGIKDPRRELGREKFLEEVIAFAEQSRETINAQVRKMGASCDWSQEKYTFDETRNRAVNEMFRRLLEDGLIERGDRLVNWDPQFKTTLSDDEVFTKQVTAKLLTFTYDKDFPIAISTTRPETKFGDTAVAVHPADARYTQYVGKTFTPTFCGKQLTVKIIADEAVDPTFGTGALGVTPAHSMIDAEMAQRHGLSSVPVIDQNACLLPVCGEAYAGKPIKEAREQIEEALRAAGVLRSVEEIEQNLPIAERGGAPVEQLPMKQWFIRVNKPFTLRQNTLGKWKKGEQVTLKELMIETIQGQHTRIVPDRFEKTYFAWVNNLRDWCISRQIWFGHRIPVWYRGEESQYATTAPGADWQQDPDTLDTWFSAGLWTFSTLGWPEAASVDEQGNLVKTGDLLRYHPTAVLETGYDIIFFWVARMILMTTYALGETPFKDVYLHGLVRAEDGQKMSKSLGNSLDPLDLIPKYGTDAVRLSLLMGTTPGQDTKLSEAKIEGFRNFTNKLWNISRFVLSQVETMPNLSEAAFVANSLPEAWIFQRLCEVTTSVTKKLESYQFASAGEELREFTWNDFADWYLEIAKIQKPSAAFLAHVLSYLLRLWHPFTPFVTEEIWQRAGFDGLVASASWPQTLSCPSPEATCGFVELQALVTEVRRLRAEQKIEATKKLAISISTSAEQKRTIFGHLEWMKRLMNASSIEFVEGDLPKSWVAANTGAAMIGFNLEDAVDFAEEREKWRKERNALDAYIVSTSKKLENKEFLEKAPQKVINEMQNKCVEANARRIWLEERINAIKETP